jgi:hypothetical protein
MNDCKGVRPVLVEPSSGHRTTTCGIRAFGLQDDRKAAEVKREG